MKKTVLSLLLATLATVPVWALNDVLHIAHNGIDEYAPLEQIDSIWFSNDGATMFILAKDSTNAISLSRSAITAMNYVPTDDCPKELKVAFSESSATVRNPYLLCGVSVTTDGAYVTVSNTNITTELSASLSGSTSNGAYIYNGTYKTTLELNGVSITSQRGAAIDIECGKRIDLLLKKNTVSTLVDCANGEQKAALYCKGHLEIDKAGTLNVTGKTAHAISAKEYIKLKKSDGTINILGAVKDGIHCQQYFLGNGFNVNISNVLDDGILVELDGEANDDEITDGSFILNAGTYNINIPATTSASKAGGWPGGGGGGGWPGGGETSTGAKAKGIKGEGPVVINDGALLIQTNKSEAEGLESKTSVTINGGNHYFKCYDDCINSSGIINFAGGNTVCYGYKNDAVDSNYGKKGAITISGGNVFAYSTAGSPEEGLDCDNNSYIVVTGGIAISAGGSQGGGGGGWGGSSSSSSSIGSSTQGYYLGSSPSSYNTSYYYTLCNTSGTAICTYKFEGSVSNSLSLLTASDLGKGSVTVKYSTSAPTASSAQVNNLSGTGVFWVAPTVTTTGTSATVTAK